jgi:hypothetical protein
MSEDTTKTQIDEFEGILKKFIEEYGKEHQLKISLLEHTAIAVFMRELQMSLSDLEIMEMVEDLLSENQLIKHKTKGRWSIILNFTNKEKYEVETEVSYSKLRPSDQTILNAALEMLNKSDPSVLTSRKIEDIHIRQIDIPSHTYN